MNNGYCTVLWWLILVFRTGVELSPGLRWSMHDEPMCDSCVVPLTDDPHAHWTTHQAQQRAQYEGGSTDCRIMPPQKLLLQSTDAASSEGRFYLENLSRIMPPRRPKTAYLASCAINLRLRMTLVAKQKAVSNRGHNLASKAVLLAKASLNGWISPHKAALEAKALFIG